MHDIDFMPGAELIEVDYHKGSEADVVLHDGSVITLKKLHENYDPMNKMGAILELNQAKADEKFLTGLIYFDPNRPTFSEHLDLGNTPLAYLNQEQLRPSLKHLDSINQKLSK